MIKQQANKGAAMLMFVLFFAFTIAALTFTLNQSIFSDFRDFNRLAQSKQAFFTSESLLEDMVYRQVFDTFSLNSTETLALGGATAQATTTYDAADDEYLTVSEALFGTVERRSAAVVTITSGSSFNFGLQAGTGGITMTNSATVVGNVYSNGSVIGANRSGISGDVVSAGPTGLVEDVHATGSVYAHFIDDIETDVSAHYTTDRHPTGPMASDIPSGQRYTPVADQPPTSLPISTTTIQGWKDDIDDAISDGTGEDIDASDPLCATGTYTLNIDRSMGFIKVGCNLVIEGNNTDITLTGPVWVEGNISFTNGPNIRVDSTLGRKSVQMIAASSTNKTTSSKISVAQSTSFDGSGDSRSFIMLLSENESAYLDGGQTAISLGNSTQGDLLVYAGSGLVSISQQIHLKEVTGYRISIGNNSSVVYESGLSSLLFTAGPGGGYNLADWRQVP